jgi:hypothetical protein
MTARRFPSIIYATEQGARNACARIDEHLGYPRHETDHRGRQVWTQGFTAPVPLEDGTWAVQVPEDAGPIPGIGRAAEARNLAALRRRDPEEGE